MNFDFSDDAKALADQAKKLFADRSGPSKARAAMAKDAPDFDATLWREVAELGWTAARVPEAHGGLGLSAEEVCVLADAAGASLAVTPLVSTLLATEALVLAGSDAQQARWLPGIADGSVIAVPAWSGKGGVTPASVAVRVESRGLTGINAPVADLPGAHLAIVAGRGSGWHVTMACRPDQPWRDGQDGRNPRPRPSPRASDVGCRPCPTARHGGQLSGLARPRRRPSWRGRRSVRPPRRWRWRSITPNSASPSGQTIGRYQGVKHKCADMYIKLELARAHALHGVAMIGSGGAELRQAAAAARVASLDALAFCAEENVQLHGGIGFTWESDCQFYYRRARTLAAALGPRNWWADRLVRALELRNRAAA